MREKREVVENLQSCEEEIKATLVRQFEEEGFNVVCKPLCAVPSK